MAFFEEVVDKREDKAGEKPHGKSESMDPMILAETSQNEDKIWERRQRAKRHPRRYRDKPVTFFIPNVLTLMGMCCGITGIHAALVGHMNYAVLAILLAAFFDGIDGRVARRLHAASRFGAELDSLSDFATFGISPSVIMFVFSLNLLGKPGWAVALLFSMCMALRLARFNTHSIENSSPVWMEGLATGIPAPAGAFLLLMPIMFNQWLALIVPPWLCAVWAAFVAGLLVSKIPTFLLKGKGKKQLPPVTLVFLLVFIACAYSFSWATMIAVGIVYLASIPASIAYAAKKRKEYKASVM